jgi:hypothetical protein
METASADRRRTFVANGERGIVIGWSQQARRETEPWLLMKRSRSASLAMAMGLPVRNASEAKLTAIDGVDTPTIAASAGVPVSIIPTVLRVKSIRLDPTAIPTVRGAAKRIRNGSVRQEAAIGRRRSFWRGSLQDAGLLLPQEGDEGGRRGSVGLVGIGGEEDAAAAAFGERKRGREGGSSRGVGGGGRSRRRSRRRRRGGEARTGEGRREGGGGGMEDHGDGDGDGDGDGEAMFCRKEWKEEEDERRRRRRRRRRREERGMMEGTTKGVRININTFIYF